jgi:predicted Zn-dependent peptidase
VVGNVSGLQEHPGQLEELFERFEAEPVPESYDGAPPFAPQVLVRERDSNQSHLRLSYRPAVDVSDARERAALTIYSTLLGGSMGSRLFDEIREQRGLAYSVSAFPHAYADVPVLQLSAGLESAKCGEALRRMRDIVTELREDGPTQAEVERARAFAAGARTIAFENTGAVARYAAQQTIVHGGGDIDPESVIATLDQVTYDEVRAVAAGVSDELSVACVGPHTVEELEAA